jgi:hypothetical protein
LLSRNRDDETQTENLLVYIDAISGGLYSLQRGGRDLSRFRTGQRHGCTIRDSHSEPYSLSYSHMDTSAKPDADHHPHTHANASLDEHSGTEGYGFSWK